MIERKKEKTPLPGRKRRALKHLAIALAAVCLVNGLLHMGCLLPIQAIREVEEREGVHGRVVARLWEPEIHKTDLFYLTENEDMVFLGNTYLSLLGWSPGFGWAVDCTGEDAPVYGAYACSNRGGREDVWLFYGRVEDLEAETLELSLRAITSFDGQGMPVYEEELCFSAPRADWREREGRYCFLLRCQIEEWPETSRVYPFLRGLDGQGRVLWEGEIEEGIYSTFG